MAAPALAPVFEVEVGSPHPLGATPGRLDSRWLDLRMIRIFT
jgi:hypothetical protein